LTGTAWAQPQAPAKTVNKTYTTPAAAEPVIYSSKDAITKGFESHTLMLHDSHASYMVETAQRDKTGGAEVHLMDTDVTYVIKGSATIITGGTVEDVAPTPARPGNPHPEYEIRGAKIVGGKAIQLSAGDSIVIPKGVPHQFSEVHAPFWYFNVKVR
jgi:mannose-6-phosphate isomerase-like protein (cupin superfamily)